MVQSVRLVLNRVLSALVTNLTTDMDVYMDYDCNLYDHR